MTRLIFVRHGESEVTVRRVVGGPRSCTGLSDLGRRQAERLRDRWLEHPEIAADAVYSSAYPRARETAEIVLPALGHDSFIVDAAFGEHDPGPLCDGLTYDEFEKRFGDPDWENDPHGETFPGGESIAAFQLRIGDAVRSVIERHRGGKVVVFCHGGVVDTVLRQSLRTSGTGIFEVWTKNTSITEVELVRPGRWRLVRYNDAAHLGGLPASTHAH
jgi:probable phosphoglycerate mutase